MGKVRYHNEIYREPKNYQAHQDIPPGTDGEVYVRPSTLPFLSTTGSMIDIDGGNATGPVIYYSENVEGSNAAFVESIYDYHLDGGAA